MNSASVDANEEQRIISFLQGLRRVIPQGFDFGVILKKYPTLYEESMNTVLCQEIEKYNNLINLLQRDSQTLVKAVQGMVIMNNYYEEVLESLNKNQVPKAWGNIFLSMKPLMTWFEDLEQRVRFFKDWVDFGKPKVFWFSGFSFPQAFVTGSMQNYARQRQIEIN